MDLKSNAGIEICTCRCSSFDFNSVKSNFFKSDIRFAIPSFLCGSRIINEYLSPCNRKVRISNKTKAPEIQIKFFYWEVLEEITDS